MGSFGDGFAGNFALFGVNNTSSSLTEKNNILVLCNAQTKRINDAVGAEEKKVE